MTAVMPPDLASPRTDVERLAALRARLNDVLKGKPAIVHDLLVCLLARGHVLLEDRPGLGKTTLAKALAESLAGRFARVQCTPDLLPSDITGFNLFNQKTREFEFRPGPVFSDVLLADEINRATPRTQSALLESMAERQVTVDAERFPLAEAFFVIATQNPHEQHGTYPLPEAQLDRFAMRLEIGYPDADDERAILAAAVADARRGAGHDPAPVLDIPTLHRLQTAVAATAVDPRVQDYLVRLARESRHRAEIAAGVSPRGTIIWQRAAQARAFLDGRPFVTPVDIQEVARPVLGVRIGLEAAEANAAIDRLLADVEVPA
ncbi:MAG: AAA family ATPase [Planctomycetaceae bacterium]